MGGEEREAIRPDQTLWEGVRAGRVTERDVDSRGRLLAARGIVMEDLIRRYEWALRRAEALHATPQDGASRDGRASSRDGRASSQDGASESGVRHDGCAPWTDDGVAPDGGDDWEANDAAARRGASALLTPSTLVARLDALERDVERMRRALRRAGVRVEASVGAPAETL